MRFSQSRKVEWVMCLELSLQEVIVDIERPPFAIEIMLLVRLGEGAGELVRSRCAH